MAALLLVINIYDLFYETESLNITNYADDRTRFTFFLGVKEILLKHECNKMFEWFQNNYFTSS